METKDFKFTIANDNWLVKYVDNLEDGEGNVLFGQTLYGDNIIRIATHRPNGKRYSDKEIQRTLLHELVHVIFAEGQYLGSCNDEPLVEWVARCLQDLLKFKDKII
jgi:hypothetical protein